MPDLPPWVRGPFELLQHAETHYNEKNDIDKRIALISFDNTIEVAITTYLQLHPQLRKGAEYSKDNVQKWLYNYHAKIKFYFDTFLEEMGFTSNTSIEEIIWYHSLRNELYHSGNGLVPEIHCLDGVRQAAIEIMQLLFNIDAKTIISSSQRIAAQPESKDNSTAQSLFLHSFILLERTLLGTALTLGMETDHVKEGGNPFWVWRLLQEQLSEGLGKYEELVKQAIKVRNELVNPGIANYKEQELQQLTIGLNELTNYLQSYGFSLNILNTIKERYGDWVDPRISSIRIIQKAGSSFLEVNYYSTGLYDEESKRVNLDFISGDTEIDEPLFSPAFSAKYNAERFFDELDLYSIVMTGIGDLLFTKEGLDAAAKYCGADKGKPLGNLTRR